MLNTSLLEIIVFCLKLIAYSSNAQMADIDMLKAGVYQGSISYEISNNKMIVSMAAQNKKQPIMTVSTIDNGLYSVKPGNEDPIKIDLASYYIKLDWKNLNTVKKRFKTKDRKWLTLSSGPGNIYVNYDKLTFIIHKKFLQKK